MKSSQLNNSTTKDSVDETADCVKLSLWKRFKAFMTQFRRDLREPIAGTEALSRWGKVKMRAKHLFRRYGWKLLVAICVYYLIRDGILYILIPYLVAKKLLID